MDQLNGTDHLAAYGLGSPFPEDSKLCAALEFILACCGSRCHSYNGYGTTCKSLWNGHSVDGC